MSYIYFIRHNLSGLVKIGCSANPAQRFRSYGKNTKTLKVINGDFSFERILHKRFAAHRVKGEWFRNCIEIQDFMMNTPSAIISEEKRRHRSILFNDKDLSLLEQYCEEHDTDVSKLVRRLVKGYLEQYIKKNGGK